MMPHIEVDLRQQQLSLFEADGSIRCWPISSARNGPGERLNSGCTPRGRHRIRAKIGDQAPIHSVFVGRRPTGEIYSSRLAAQYPARDWILSRILWLGGLEPGLNRYKTVDTQSRFIYIHGTPDEQELGQAVSHGCIRMSNQAVIELFERVPVSCVVDIHE